MNVSRNLNKTSYQVIEILTDQISSWTLSTFLFTMTISLISCLKCLHHILKVYSLEKSIHLLIFMDSILTAFGFGFSIIVNLLLILTPSQGLDREVDCFLLSLGSGYRHIHASFATSVLSLIRMRIAKTRGNPMMLEKGHKRLVIGTMLSGLLYFILAVTIGRIYEMRSSLHEVNMKYIKITKRPIFCFLNIQQSLDTISTHTTL